MAQEPEALEDVPPQGHVRVVYLGPVAPHWEVHGIFGDRIVVDEFRQRAMARLQLLPPHDPQFRRNRERVARDAEREHLILDWDLGYDEDEPASGFDVERREQVAPPPSDLVANGPRAARTIASVQDLPS